MTTRDDPITTARIVCNKPAPSRIKLTAVYFLILSITYLCGRHLLIRPSSVYSNIDAKLAATDSIKEITVATTKSNNDTTITIIPPLKDLLDKNGKVIQDISWMLDFAIIGFPKSGTSFLKNYLNETDESFVYHKEFCIKKPSDLTRFVETYHELHLQFQQQPGQHSNKRIQFGLKCPGVLYRTHDLKFYKHYFPNTKFIIGLRHPVLWFQSFYNYQMGRNVTLPKSTTKLIGKCVNHEKVCTDRARFHAALARLRKTPMEENEEVDLLFGTRYEESTSHDENNSTTISFHSPQEHRALSSSNGFPNQLLLYEVRQLHQNDTAKELSNTLRNYLGLQQDLPPILSYKNIKPRAIDICDEVHTNVRRLLVNHGIDAADWIQEYLMKSSTVEVASPESFVRLLDSWRVDPCANTLS